MSLEGCCWSSVTQRLWQTVSCLRTSYKNDIFHRLSGPKFPKCTLSLSLSPTLQQTRTGSVPPPTTTGNKSSYPVRRHFASRFRNTHWLAYVHRYTGPCFKTDRRGDRPISNLTRVDTNWLTTPNICGLRELATVPAGQIDEQFAGVDADHATRSSSGRRWAICIRSWNTAKA